METIAFNNEQKVKDRFVKEALRHQKADRFLQGAWLQEKQGNERILKGCFYGCMTQTEENTLLKACEVMSLPLWLIHVSEKIFEGLPKEQALKFPVKLLKAIPLGMDSEKVWKEWSYRLLMDDKKGQITFVEKDSEQYKAINQSADLFKMDIIIESAAWSAASSAAESARSARSAAESAAESAAWSAARSARSAAESARSAARSAAESAAWLARSAAESAESAAWLARSAAESAESAARSAARSAAWSAAESAARSAAESAYYTWMQDLLIEVVKTK